MTAPRRAAALRAFASSERAGQRGRRGHPGVPCCHEAACLPCAARCDRLRPGLPYCPAGGAASPAVLLCSLKAGGVGLNLTSASRVHLLDPWW